MKKETKRTIVIQDLLYSQYRIALDNVFIVFAHIYHIHTWHRAGKYFAEIQVGI